MKCLTDTQASEDSGTLELYGMSALAPCGGFFHETMGSAQRIAGGSGQAPVNLDHLDSLADVLEVDQGDSALFRAHGFELHSVGKQGQRFSWDFAAVHFFYPVLFVF